MAELPAISNEQLNAFSRAILSAVGVDDEESRVVAEWLVDSNLCGHDSHGVIHIPAYVKLLRKGELAAGASLEIVSETAAIFAADAHFGFGPTQCNRIIDKLLPMAREQGIACATMKNCSHVGRLGAWVEQIATSGLAAMMMVTDGGVQRSVAPPDGITPCIGTNPIAISVPTGGEPLTLDISTSAVANGKIRVAHFAGQQCPPGWLQDADGNPTRDPAVRFTEPKGTILPMGGEQGYKGFGLAILMNVLTAGLSGGLCPPTDPGTKMTNSVLLVAWNPERFVGPLHFSGEADKLIELVRAAKPKPSVDRIRLPGDRLSETRRQRQRDGIPLDQGTRKSLRELANELQVEAPVWL